MASEETAAVETAEVEEAKEPRVRKQIVWHTKEERELGGSFVFLGNMTPGKQMTYLGQFQGEGKVLDQAIADHFEVELADLAKKLGNRTIVAVTVRTSYVSRAPHTERVNQAGEIVDSKGNVKQD